jgi:hypothetical protein
MFREEHRLRVFENRVLRRIFGPKRDEVIGGCRKLHNEELLYSSAKYNQNDEAKNDVIRHIARMGIKKNAYRILVGKQVRKRSLGRNRRRWVKNIKMDLREVGSDGMDMDTQFK